MLPVQSKNKHLDNYGYDRSKYGLDPDVDIDEWLSRIAENQHALIGRRTLTIAPISIAIIKKFLKETDGSHCVSPKTAKQFLANEGARSIMSIVMRGVWVKNRLN